MPPLIGKSASQARRQIGGADGQQFAVGIEPVAVLQRRTCGRWPRFPRPPAENTPARSAAARPDPRAQATAIRSPAGLAARRRACGPRARPGRGPTSRRCRARRRPARPAGPAASACRPAGAPARPDRAPAPAHRVSPMCATMWAMRGQKPPSPPLNPQSFGICVLASTNAMPHLNPMSTVSDTKFTTAPPFTSQARTANTATSSAAPIASAAKRAASPPASSPIEVPTSSEIADVAVMAVWRELQNAQKTRPPNRQAYRPASGGKPGERRIGDRGRAACRPPASRPR